MSGSLSLSLTVVCGTKRGSGGACTLADAAFDRRATRDACGVRTCCGSRGVAVSRLGYPGRCRGCDCTACGRSSASRACDGARLRSITDPSIRSCTLLLTSRGCRDGSSTMDTVGDSTNGRPVSRCSASSRSISSRGRRAWNTMSRCGLLLPPCPEAPLAAGLPLPSATATPNVGDIRISNACPCPSCTLKSSGLSSSLSSGILLRAVAERPPSASIRVIRRAGERRPCVDSRRELRDDAVLRGTRGTRGSLTGRSYASMIDELSSQSLSPSLPDTLTTEGRELRLGRRRRCLPCRAVDIRRLFDAAELEG